MTFRSRLIVAAALAVAIAIALASVVAYFVVREQLRNQLDDSLRSRAATLGEIAHLEADFHSGKFVVDLPGPTLGAAGGYFQAVAADGSVALARGEATRLPVTNHVKDVAKGRAGPFFRDARVAGTHVRIYTFPSQRLGQVALELTRPLSEIDGALRKIRLTLLLVALGGITIAAGLGYLVARAALAPVRRLTETTEHVTETRDLGSRIDARGSDELSRLAASFNTMLAALEDSMEAQRQLVQDASHELRTPLTSLRTNMEVLAGKGDSLPKDERERLLRDVTVQLTEMSAVVSELMELARGAHHQQEPEDVRLDLLVEGAIDRARRRRDGVEFSTDLEPTLVHGVPASIERAVGNLLDNAVKWSPDGGTVEVTVNDGRVVVRDHGPGIAEEELPHVFDRFYRSPGARSTPGSGLGLAIVRQIAQAHGGDVRAERAEGGGTRVELALDGSPNGR
jgi:two-component system, OmpR family, sensor histidine kinase MprB